MTKAGIGYGMELWRSNMAGTPVFAKLDLEILSMTPPSKRRDTPDATHAASVDGYDEVVAGIKRTGEITVEINWVPDATDYDTLQGDFELDTLRNYWIVAPIAGGAARKRMAFGGLVTGLSPAMPNEGKMTATVTFKASGKPVFETHVPPS